jgi:tetratricopeptide (TPR) repeat protein
MAQDSSNNTDAPKAEQPLQYPEELKARARAYFTKGAETAYTLNFDYAIELYLDGLSFWPEAVDEGHKPLREIALRRQAAGGKKSGFSDGSKYKKASGRNPKDAMLKAEYLLSKDPVNLDHMSEMLKAAVAGSHKETGQWIANLLFERNRQQEKPSFHTYSFLKDCYIALENFPRALQSCQMALQLKPRDEALQEVLRDLSAQATMQQGKYDSEKGDFRDSIRDRESQEKLQSQEQLIQSDSQKVDSIAQARQSYQANPADPAIILRLADTLVATERDEDDLEAISILDKAYAEMDQFHFKQRSGEILLKLHQRQLRTVREQLRENSADESLKKRYETLSGNALTAELNHYKLCVDNYPTDMRLKHEYGKSLFRAKKYEEALPVFQQAGADLRFRLSSMKYVGQCFYYMKWYPDAAAKFEEALQTQEGSDDAAAKELRYNLGRAYEADGKLKEALDSYRKVAQVDFNYLDVRSRVEALRKKLSE